MRLGAGLNLNSTALTRNPGSLGPTSITRIERGQPRNTVLLSAAYRGGDFGALLRVRRFGEVAAQYSDGAGITPQTFGARWLTDANVSYTILRKYTFTAGADNLFDVYPDRDLPPSFTGLGAIQPYNPASPFGFNGRFVYARLSIYL
jgi:TonB dependent receptor.